MTALGGALDRGDAAAAAALFGEDSYWRDLVTFTWNITTAEGNAEVREMIERAVIPAKPSAWQLEGEGSEAGGVTEGWIRSLCLHDPVWYDHLPFLPFPEPWPVFSPKDWNGAGASRVVMGVAPNWPGMG